MNHVGGLVLALLTFIAFHPARSQPSTAGHSDLDRAIGHVIEDPRFDNAFWGVHVVDLETRETLVYRNGGKSFVPASNVKLFTTSAALEQLGPAYRYHTRLFVDGPVENGVLRGNLIVRGAADPTIGGHYDAEMGEWEAEIDATHLFREWADSLRVAGITRIEGDVIGDDDIIDDVPLGANWSWDDETYYYSAQVSGLAFNDNVVHMHVEGQRVDMPAAIRWDPYNTDYIEVINRTRTIDPDSSLEEGYHRFRGTNIVDVTTLVPAGRDDVEEIAVENPTLFFVHVLREELMRSGIAVSGRPIDVDELSIKPDYTDAAYRRVAHHASMYLSKIVAIINKPSQNLYAEMLLKLLGAEFPRRDTELKPGSSEMGVETAMATFARAGVDTSRIRLVDGSGLSRLNLVTPQMTTRLLAYMWHHEDASVRQAFRESLPLAGVHGTLRNRFRSGPVRGNMRGKTGSLSAVSSLSGYIQSESGRRLAFSLMCNHFTTRSRDVREAQDAIAELLSRFRR